MERKREQVKAIAQTPKSCDGARQESSEQKSAEGGGKPIGFRVAVSAAKSEKSRQDAQ